MPCVFMTDSRWRCGLIDLFGSLSHGAVPLLQILSLSGMCSCGRSPCSSFIFEAWLSQSNVVSKHAFSFYLRRSQEYVLCIRWASYHGCLLYILTTVCEAVLFLNLIRPLFKSILSCVIFPPFKTLVIIVERFYKK